MLIEVGQLIRISRNITAEMLLQEGIGDIPYPDHIHLVQGQIVQIVALKPEYEFCIQVEIRDHTRFRWWIKLEWTNA